MKSGNQTSRQVIGAVKVTDGNVIILDVDAGDGTVVEQEPGFKSVGCIPPGQVEDRAHQMHEESAVTHDGDTVFGFPLFIAMTGQ